MAFAYKNVRATIFGTCYEEQEEWSTGFYLGKVDGDAAAPSNAAADRILVHWEAFFETAVVQVSNKYKTTGVKLSLINTNGTTDVAATIIRNYVVQPVGPDGNIKYPPQISYVATLQSALTTGPGSKGRMFLPGICCAIEDNGRMNSGNTGNKALHFKNFLDAINADGAIPDNVILASQGRTVAPVVSPLNTIVTRIRCGDVYDTQRRRRNGMRENYSGQLLEGNF